MTLGELKKKYHRGVRFLQAEGYYTRVIEEIDLLVKYFDANYFYHLLTENILDDIKGTFRSFVNKELPKVYQEIVENPAQPLTVYYERQYTSLMILKSCIGNMRYQVSGLMRFEQTRTLPFKSTYLQGVHRKLNGKIQEYYRDLSEHYKAYFRNQFVQPAVQNGRISLQCLERLMAEMEDHFITPLQRFMVLQEALAFVHQYLVLQLRGKIQERISAIFNGNSSRINRLMEYFIHDLKCDFIRMVDRQHRKGKDFEWIRRGLLLFLDSNRFDGLLRKVIFQSVIVPRVPPKMVKRDAG